jgi:alcohol dehydrogenase
MNPVIDKVLPLERAAEGLRMLEAREVFGKVVIKP